jgi:5S rRNA maturation endonuclease (ribonuclease M5)
MIDRAMIGHDGTRFTIPFFAPNPDMRTSQARPEILLTIRFRRDDLYGTETWDDKPIPKYSGMRGRNGLYLYPENLLARDFRDWVVVCEGELDALRLWQENIPAVSVTNGAGQLHRVPELLKPYSRIRRLFIAADRDEAGMLAGRKLTEVARAKGYRVAESRWIEAKDVTELYKGGGDLRKVQWHGDADQLPD